MLLRHVALVSESESVNFKSLMRVSAALQKQAIKDLGPIWNIKATVDAFESLDDVPIGYWPIVIRDDIHVRAAGIHEDKDGQPFALVQAGPGWSLTASHENLEMLVDPFGRRLASGQSPIEEQGRVEFLVEVCDPSEDAAFGYTVNGVLVSDFYTPEYFNPVVNPGVRHSFTGAIKRPRQVLRGGYLSWHDPVSDDWFQEIFFGSEPQFRNIGPLTNKGEDNFRTQIYYKTPEAFATRVPQEESAGLLTAARDSVETAASSRAKFLRQRIEQVLARR